MPPENEKPASVVQPGAKAPAAVAPPVAAKPAAQPPFVPTPAARSVPLFGGHKGGGKKRADGLPAGSPEAIEADKAKDRERKRLAALKAKGENPAPLPSAVAPPPHPGAPVAPDPGGVPGAVAPMAGAAGVAYAWSARQLQKPAKLVVRILDRARQWDIFRRLDKSNLPPEVKAEIKRDAEWKESAQNDFADALADCTAIELNKRQVNSANAHWITLGMSASELALAHFALTARIDKLILAEKVAAPLANEKPQEKK
jgi:hypothetical protein